MPRPLQPLLRRAFGLLLVAPLLSGCALVRGPVEPARLTLLQSGLPAAVAAPADPILSPLYESDSQTIASQASQPSVTSSGLEAFDSEPASPSDREASGTELGEIASVQQGIASYYASRFHGRRTASGARYDENVLSAAHRTLPLGTRVRVTNLGNDRNVVLTVNDRGPYVGNRVIDLSLEAARRLGFVQNGLTPVRVDVLQPVGLAVKLP